MDGDSDATSSHEEWDDEKSSSEFLDTTIFGSIASEEEGGCDRHADSSMIGWETVGGDATEGELFGRYRKIESDVGSGSVDETFDNIVDDEDKNGIEKECEWEVCSL